MDDAVAFAYFTQPVCNVNVARNSNKKILFFRTFSSLMGPTNDDIDKLITAFHGETYGITLAQRISIPVVIIMHIKALCFELYDRNNLYALL